MTSPDLTRVSIADCKPGMYVHVQVDGGAREWRGPVIQLRKPNKYVLEFQAEKYFEFGVERHRWQPKKWQVANRASLIIFEDVSQKKQAEAKAAAEKKMYVEARIALQQKRLEVMRAFKLLNDTGLLAAPLTPLSSTDEVNAAKKAVLKRFHPDLVNQRAKNLPVEEADALRAESKRLSDAVAVVSDFVQKRTGAGPQLHGAP